MSLQEGGDTREHLSLSVFLCRACVVDSFDRLTNYSIKIKLKKTHRCASVSFLQTPRVVRKRMAFYDFLADTQDLLTV